MKMNNSNIKSANVQYTFYALASNIAILDPPPHLLQRTYQNALDRSSWYLNGKSAWSFKVEFQTL